MVAARKITAAATVLLIVASVGYADMMPTCQAGVRHRRGNDGSCAPLLPQPEVSCLSGYMTRNGFGGPVVWFPHEAELYEGQVSQPEPMYLLRDGQSSFVLCLYSLLGLGLCKSTSRMKRLFLGTIPEWYHTGGPFQIGHSHAIATDCSCASAPAFVQPNHRAESPASRYAHGVLVFALWRASQYAPAVLASRAPPGSSNGTLFS